MQGRILILAGSDSGGGAGIQGDIKTISALGGYAATAITALTVQNTLGVTGIHPVPPAFIYDQAKAVLDDIGADAIKTGMLHDVSVIDTVAQLLAEYPAIPAIIDPVMVAKSGDTLLAQNAFDALKEKIFPKAFVITPNLPEAEMLLEEKIETVLAMREASKKLAALGAKAVLLKGGHLLSNTITDILWDGQHIHEWQSPRIQTKHTHGTGCSLASAIATGLAQKMPLPNAISRARDYVQGAITNAPQFGQGHGPLNHGWKKDQF